MNKSRLLTIDFKLLWEYIGYIINKKVFKMINKKEAINLIDALKEWFFLVQPKELEKKEEGLNSERYETIINKLNKIAYSKNINTYSIDEIKEAWKLSYNEDMQKLYKGFFNILKK